MSRPSFRPRPLDIHKKLPIVKSVKEFEDDEPTTTATRTSHSQIHRLAPEAETEVSHTPSKKPAAEIPIPQFVNVDTYETDYARTFAQPTSYLRGRGARSEIGEFIEYDLDNEDDDWLEEFNNERRNLTPEKFEAILFKLEVLDHKTRERSTAITSTLGSPIPVVLRLESAAEALQTLSIRYVVLQSVYNYWKAKRERWQKPILRRLQPPPPVHDTNPYNVFRPREKAHRLHTRRMQRRENNVQSFEKLRQIRRNLDQTKMMIAILIKREEKKREVMENEVNIQRIQFQYRNEAELVKDGFPLQGYPSVSGRYSVEDEYADSDDDMSYRNKPQTQPAILHNSDSRLKMIVSGGRLKQDTKRNNLYNGWLLEEDPHEPVLLFTKPLLPDRLAAAGIVPPQEEFPKENGSARPAFSFRGRIGRGGRIVFDRWNPLLRTPNHQAGNPHLATDANFPGG